ncbi:MAG: hypothetical protein Q9207_000452 [Kuettlingeria erythrocarpa]
MRTIPWDIAPPEPTKPWLIVFTAIDDDDGKGQITVMAISPASLNTIIPCVASLTWYDWRAHFKTAYDQTTCTFVSKFTLITMTDDMRDACTVNGGVNVGDPATPTLEVKGVDDRGYQMLNLYVDNGYQSSLELYAKRGEAWLKKHEPFSEREKDELEVADFCLGNKHWDDMDGAEDRCLECKKDKAMDAAANAEKGLEVEDVEADEEHKRIQDEIEARLNKRKGRKHKRDEDDDFFEVMAVKKPKQRVE